VSSEPRHAVVTGSSSGIGLAVARMLLQQGWRVSGFDIAAPGIEHPAFNAVEVDLANGAACDTAAHGVAGAAALVHAAGVLRVGSLSDFDPAQAELMWTLHVQCASRLARVLMPAMIKAANGRVILIGSRVARGIGGRSQYAATKAAALTLARSWAAETAASGVTVNVISPAATRTAMLDDPARVDVKPKLPPIGRLIEPDEVAALAVYLLSPAAAAITGQDIQVCGGSSLERG
jgi:3-oxoacyl-[acyl-carrier protein] reductase